MYSNVITGCNGFVGLNLSSFFKNINYSFIGISRKPNIGQISYNDFNVNILNSSKVLIHLAGKAHDTKNIINHSEYYEVNTDLTKKIFDTFLKSRCNVFIFMSSVKSVADDVCGVLTEADLPSPKTHYGKSKLLAEKYILSKKIPKNKKIYILRPCMIHGPNNKGNLNLLYKLVSRNIPWPLGMFENKRSYCSIENLSFVIKELIDNNEIPSGIYNVSDDKPLSTNDLIHLIADSQNKSAQIVNISIKIINIIAKLGNYISLPLNTERLKKLTESYIVSNEKIKKAIGKSFPVDSKDGMLKTFKSFYLTKNKI